MSSPVDQIYNPQIFGTPKAAQSNQSFPQSAGKATIPQNSNGVTVACTNVKSDSLVFVSPMGDTVASGTAMVQVGSIVPAASFDILTSDAANVGISGGLDIAWHIFDVQ